MPQEYTPKHVITFADAQARITNWHIQQKAISEALPQGNGIPPQESPVLGIRAFTLRFVEMFNLCASIYNQNYPNASQIAMLDDTVNESLHYNALRFYNGLRESVIPGKVEACLVCVPVSGLEYGPVNNDIDENVYPENNTGDFCKITSGGSDEMNIGNNDAIYDFSFPCPSTCDLSSPLLLPYPQS